MNLDRNKKASPMYYQIKEYIKEKIEKCFSSIRKFSN